MLLLLLCCCCCVAERGAHSVLTADEKKAKEDLLLFTRKYKANAANSAAAKCQVDMFGFAVSSLVDCGQVSYTTIAKSVIQEQKTPADHLIKYFNPIFNGMRDVVSKTPTPIKRGSFNPNDDQQLDTFSEPADITRREPLSGVPTSAEQSEESDAVEEAKSKMKKPSAPPARPKKVRLLMSVFSCSCPVLAQEKKEEKKESVANDDAEPAAEDADDHDDSHTNEAAKK